MRMKNKRAEEIAKRDDLKKERAEKKRQRDNSGILERSESIINQNPKILITCEGKNTEKDYFDHFKLPSLTLEVIGVGDNTISLVNKTIKIRDEKDNGFYDEVWCVFDADPKPDNPKQLQNFNQAIWLADRNGIKVAYSHQAFEYWLLLHFNDHQGGAMNRSLYRNALNKFLKPFNLKYDDSSDGRSKSISENLFNVLMALENGERRVCRAIQRANRIYSQLNHQNPALNESATSVFLLVEKLLKFNRMIQCPTKT